jgi:protein-tyrosine-phosphatase
MASINATATGAISRSPMAEPIQGTRKSISESVRRRQCRMTARYGASSGGLRKRTLVGHATIPPFSRQLLTKQGNATDPSRRAPYDGAYVGTIEVIVLRCCPKRRRSLSNGFRPAAEDSLSDMSTIGGLDGSPEATPVPLFGVDGTSDQASSRGRPTEVGPWGFQMTGADTGVYRPISQHKLSTESPFGRNEGK